MSTIATVPLSLPERLKQATQDLHVSLENALGLLSPPVNRERVVTLLDCFYGFHAVWEPAIKALIGDEAYLAPRRRAALAAADLAALGRSPEEIDSLPRCRDAALLADEAEAWGSLYVMEGSTLGGKLISRRLAEESWMPKAGLRYFDPHGERTGILWRETRERLGALSGSATEQSVIDGARATFQRLAAWLEPAYRGIR